MQRLSGMDASFLYMETPTLHTHVVGTLILDPSTMPEPRNPFDALEELLEARLHVLPQFRWMVRTVPMNIDHPVFIDDPDFDLSRHVKRSALPSPGTREQLAEFIGMIASVPLNRDRPMWKMWMVEGLEDGNVALVSKMHHSGIDGSTGSDMMAELFDLSADAGPLEPPPEWIPEDQPSNWKLAGDAIAPTLREALGVMADGVEMLVAALAAIEDWADEHASEGPPPRAIGRVETQYRDATVQCGARPFPLWMLQRPIDAYRALASAERARVDTAIAGTGWEPILALAPRHRLVKQGNDLAWQSSGLE